MYSGRTRWLPPAVLLPVFLLVAACGNNLLPSAQDMRPAAQPDTTGAAVGQKAPGFSVSDTNGSIVTLASALAGKKAVIFYFTMWCPICDDHLTNMVNTIAPAFPTMSFYAVDYVSGTVADAKSSQAANGFAGLPTLADVDHALTQGFQGTMGTTVVIDSAGIIAMNEGYLDSRLQAVLAGLP